jgi:hypothetical protein
MNDGDREELIRTAIKSAVAKGITLSIQTWGVVWDGKNKTWAAKKDQKCCALGCVMLEFQDKLPRKVDWRNWTVETILECDTVWVRSFQKGFDRYEKSELDATTFAYDLGFLLSEELIDTNAQLNLPNL